MPMPQEYWQASRDFERFMADAKETAMLATHNQTYTMVQAVLTAFRRRLTLPQAIAFAGVLPPVLRAIFVSDWDTDEPLRPFENRAAMTREVMDFRKDHNTSPDSAIRDVASALAHHVDQAAFQRVLRTLPAEAADFWRA